MSAISNVGTSSSLHYLAVQSSGVDPASDPTAAASSSSGAGACSTAAGASTPSPLADLRSQIETAVTSAVQQLPAGSSPQDIFSAVRSAVEDTLKANGLDPSKLAGHHGGHHHHHAQAIPADASAQADGGSTSSASASSDSDGDSDQQATTDPLLAALQATPGNSATTPSLGANSSSAASGASPTSALALFATGPSAVDALRSLVQQLSANAGTSGASTTPTSPLLAALQNSAANTPGLSGIFLQLFHGFPNGTGFDVQV